MKGDRNAAETTLLRPLTCYQAAGFVSFGLGKASKEGE